MGGGDKCLQIARRAVAILKRKREYAVITPIAGARKLRDGHQLDGGNAQIGQLIEMRHDG